MSWRLRRAGGLAAMCTVAAGGIAGVVGQSAAEAPARADVVLTDCPAAGLPARAVFAALAMELDHDGIRHARLLQAPDDEAAAHILIVLDCAVGATQVALRVRGTTAVGAQRNMEIEDVPRLLRPRAVALAVAELARSVWFASPSAELPDAGSPVVASSPDGSAPLHEAQTALAPVPPDARSAPLAGAPALAPSAAQPGAAWGLGAGPAARWFAGADGPAFGGRLGAWTGRWRVGTDLLWDDAGDPKLGLAVVWAAWMAKAAEWGAWRLGIGPRLAVGAGWSRSSPGSGELPLGGPIPVERLTPTAPQTTRGWYVESAVVAQVTARTRGGWRIGLGMDAALGWGNAPAPARWLPRLRPNLGAGLLAGRDF